MTGTLNTTSPIRLTIQDPHHKGHRGNARLSQMTVLTRKRRTQGRMTHHLLNAKDKWFLDFPLSTRQLYCINIVGITAREMVIIKSSVNKNKQKLHVCFDRVTSINMYQTHSPPSGKASASAACSDEPDRRSEVGTDLSDSRRPVRRHLLSI